MGHAVLNIEGAIGLSLVLVALFRSAPAYAAPKPSFHLDRRDALAFAAIIALILAGFWRSVNFYFLSDDFLLLKHAQTFWANFPAIFFTPGGDGFYRPVTYLSMAFTIPWAGTNPVPWHAIAILLHAVNTLLVFLVARALGLSRLPAYFAAALFAIHASRPEAVVWMAARADLLATCFALLALWLFIYPRYALSLVFMTLAFLCKESSYTLPLVFTAYVTVKRISWRPLTPFFALAAAFFAWRWYLFGGIGGYLNQAGQPEVFNLSSLSILETLALRLWAILFFPINWSNRPGLLLRILAAFYLAGLILLVTARSPRRAIILQVALLILLAIPPLQQLLIGADMQKSRLLYLPSVAFCLLLATLLEARSPKSQWAIATAIVVFNLAALFHNLTPWEQASQKARNVCLQAALCSNPAVHGLPPSLNGVYFFANGFPECVELQRSSQPRHPCTLTWDDKTGTLSQVPYDIHKTPNR